MASLDQLRAGAALGSSRTRCWTDETSNRKIRPNRGHPVGLAYVTIWTLGGLSRPQVSANPGR